MFGIVLQPASILEHMFDVEDFACSLGIKVVESSKARFGYFAAILARLWCLLVCQPVCVEA